MSTLCFLFSNQQLPLAHPSSLEMPIMAEWFVLRRANPGERPRQALEAGDLVPEMRSGRTGQDSGWARPLGPTSSSPMGRSMDREPGQRPFRSSPEGRVVWHPN